MVLSITLVTSSSPGRPGKISAILTDAFQLGGEEPAPGFPLKKSNFGTFEYLLNTLAAGSETCFLYVQMQLVLSHLNQQIYSIAY